MQSFSESVEVVRITFLFGAVLAMLYKKYTGVTPGGIIVPPFLALIMDVSFFWIGAVLAISFITNVIYTIVFKNLALTKRWTLIINIGFGAFLTILSQIIMSRMMPFNEITAFGYVLPGLISTAIYYQSTYEVTKGTMLVTAITYTFGWLIFVLLPYSLSSKLAVELASFEPLALTQPVFTIFVSIISAAIAYKFFKARSGGYMIAPVIALLISSSLIQFGLFILGVFLAYIIINLLLKYSLIVGLERFVFILFLSTAIITCIDMLAVNLQLADYKAAPLIPIIAMAIWVNDLCLQPVKKSVGSFPIPLFNSYSLLKVIT